MTTPSAKVVIDAEDLASKKIADAARKIEQNIKSIKDTGRNAKSSTEFIGTLANQLGGTQFGQYAGQLGQLNEKISQFAEVSKAGGAGALAFKAGLVGVVGVLSFKVGQAIGDAIFQTKRWRLELEAAEEAAKKLSSQVERAAGDRFGGQVKQIDMLGDPDAQKKATEDLLKQIDKDIEAKARQLDEYREKVMKVEESWIPLGDLGRSIHENNKLQVQEAERLKELFKEQALELRKKLVADEEALILQEKQKAAAEELARKKEQETKLAEEQKRIAAEAEKANNKRIAEAERIASLRQSELDRLKEEKILLTEGAEAAKQFSLERQGLDKDSAGRIAAAQAELEDLKNDKSGPDSVSIGSQAVQSRLLTRGPAEKGIDKIGKNTEQTVQRLDSLILQMDKYKTPPQLEVVG